MAEIKPIRFADKGTYLDNPSGEDTPPGARFAPFAQSVLALHPPIGVIESIQTLTDFLDAMAGIDATYGADGVLPLADAGDAADEAMRAVADLQNQLPRLPRLPLSASPPSGNLILDNLAIGIGLWCMRHQLAMSSPEPMVNALAERINAATSKQETAATYAMMQGLLRHLKPVLGSDLERSNPERPWRILHLNFAIAAIRTADATMIRYAFDSLNAALPDECAGFYKEAVVLARSPDFPAETRGLIEQEYHRAHALPAG